MLRAASKLSKQVVSHPFFIGNAQTFNRMVDTPLRRSARLSSSVSTVTQRQTYEEPEILINRRRRKRDLANVKRPMTRRVVSASTLEDVSVPLVGSHVQQSTDKEAEESDTELVAPVHKKRKRAVSDPVYIIADVERKETTFKGRLGYACLNTVLRNKKPASESIFCSRTCRLDSLKKNGIEFAKELGRKNAEDLSTIIQWNEDNNIRFFRISSEMFPYASHGTYGYSLEYCADSLAKAGALANKYGHRLTTHPGQYTQLGSPKPAVVQAAVRELTYHCQMLDLMAMGPDSVMIIHGGGVYDDKPATLERLKKSIRDLPNNVRNRLVLENDEMCYSAEDLLPICEELNVPFVYDYHHGNLFPSSLPPAAIIERANAIFRRRGIKPKQHLSEPRPGAVSLMERRAHSDRCENLPPDLPDDMDLMIEAKDKEQAVLYLHRMYNLQEVVHESLRPAAANQTMHTKGRKSTKRAQAQTAKGGRTSEEQ